MTVSIDIDLDAMDAFQEIGQLKLALKSLDEDINIDLDLDGGLGDILDNLTETMDELSESFNADLNETIDRLEGLEFDDLSVSRGMGNSGGDTGSDSGDYVPSAGQYFSGGVFEDDSDGPSGIQKAINKFHRKVDGLGDAFEISEARFNLGDGSGSASDGMTHRGIIQNAARRGGVGSFGAMMGSVAESGHFGDNPFSGRDHRSRGHMRGVSRAFRIGDSIGNLMPDIGGSGRGGMFRSLTKGFRNLSNMVEGTTSAFKSLIPNMQMWWRLIAVAIPALGAMAVQALGVASAMGAMAVAGAGVIGLGLIGHGDSMAESFRNAGEEIDELKKGLFDSFEPTADLFAPIQSEFFDFIPGQMDRVARSMEGLTVFKDDIFSLFRGATQFAAELVDIIVENEAIISDLTATFSKLIGQSILNFFEWLLETASENKQMLIDLGGIFKTLAIAIYEVFMMISRALIMLKPFFGMLSWIADLLNNKFFSSLIAIITLLYVLSSAASVVVGALVAVAGVLMTGMIPGLSAAFTVIQGITMQMLLATSASYALAHGIATVIGAATLLTGIGIAAWVGSQMISGLKQVNDIKNEMGAGGSNIPTAGAANNGGTTINEGDTVNVNMGDADTSTMEKFQSMRSGSTSRGPTGGSYTGD